MQQMKKSFIVFVLTLILFSPLALSAAYSSSTALSYLQSHANNPWVTMALAASGSQNIPSDYLKTINGTTALEYEAPILAISALNKDAKNFGSADYIAKLESFHTQNQIGDPTTLNDDAFGILALVSAGQPATDVAIANTKNFLLAHQNSDGGWGFSVGGNSDSNSTASVVVALVAAGIPSSHNSIQQALVYFKTTQNDDGGITYDPKSQYGTASDSSSTAWVIWALNALKIDPASWSKGSNNLITFLESNQTQDGYFQYQSGSGEDSFSAVTTAYAVIALLGKTLPVHVFNPNTVTQTFNFRIEGSAETVCTGQAAGPTALDIIKNASAQCGFTYSIQNTAYGPYLNQINNDTASGQTGWLYLVDNISPDVGATDYQLKTGDEVLWYFGEFGWLPTRISLQDAKISTGQSTQATVEDFSNGSWLPLSGATVTVGTRTFTTDSAGHAGITNQDGYYKVIASKSGYIRSSQVLLQIGQPSTAAVSLSANITAGDVQGTSTQTTISFIVTPSNLDFGTINPGSSSSKQLSISNNGTSALHIESAVSGDDIFINGLLINNAPWQTFKGDLGSGQSQNNSLKLNVPLSYTGGGGQKNAQIIFWATSN
jgi:hypothetical protein